MILTVKIKIKTSALDILSGELWFFMVCEHLISADAEVHRLELKHFDT